MAFDVTSYILGKKSSGGGGSGDSHDPNADVIFIDYDGTILHSYSKGEFLALSSMPANPVHEGLTAQGWNWTLADAKEYVTKYGEQVIGQNYVTSDGKTRLYIHIPNGYALSQAIRVTHQSSGGTTFDWGDGSATESKTSAGTFIYKHDYESPGDYVITIEAHGGFYFGQSQQNYPAMGFDPSSGTLQAQYYGRAEMLRKIEFGSNVTFMGSYGFRYSTEIETVTIPKELQRFNERSFGDYSFALKCLVIPDGATIANYAFTNCYSVRFASMGKNCVLNGFGSNEKELYRVSIPEDSTIGGSSFSTSAVRRVTIPKGVTLDSGVFTSCDHITNVVVSSEATSMGTNTFQNNNSLHSAIVGVNIGQSCFEGCIALEDVTIEEGVASIGKYAFRSCRALYKIVFPSTLETLGQGAFSGNYAAEIRFNGETPPSIADVDCFGAIPAGATIEFPWDSVAYLTAERMPSASGKYYRGFGTFGEGDPLPSADTSGTYSLTWYANHKDAVAGTNPITVGTGEEVYCVHTEVPPEE